MLVPFLALLFAFLMGIASIFSRRDLKNGSFRALLVISRWSAIGSSIIVAGAALIVMG